MTDATISDQLARLTVTVQSMEERFSQGERPEGDLSDIKRSLDDLRLRLWGLMQASHAEDPQSFLERFRLRRAIELSGRIAADLRVGTLDPAHKELSDLWITAIDLSRAIESVRGQQPPI